MIRTFNAWAPMAALALGACTGGEPGTAGDQPVGPGSPSGSGLRGDLRIVVVSHGQSSDPFWSVVANGAADAAVDLGVRVEYQAPTSFDMVAMSNLIDAALASRPAGLVVSIPDGDALGASIRGALEAGIPVVSMNSGDGVYRELGVLAHVGQTEYEAGRAGGSRMASEGVMRAVCVNHEVGNLAQDLRCEGFRDGLRAAGGDAEVLVVDLADPDDAQQRIANALAADPGIDGMLTLGPNGATPAAAALRETGRLGAFAFATFDLTPEVLEAVRDGDMLFAIDQQPYLQGYLPIVMLVKHVETLTMPGGGDVIRTGPGFVTAEDAERVIRLTEQGVPVTTDERVRHVGLHRRLLSRPELGAVAGAVLIWILFAVAAGPAFRSAAGTAAYLNAAAPLGILSVAVALLMIGGEFDLSVGSIIGACSMSIMLLTAHFGWPVWPAIGVTMALALAIGFANGYLVVRTGLPSFIVTLGTLFIFRGLTIAVTRSLTRRTQLGGLDDALGFGPARILFGSNPIGPFRVSIVWWMVVAAAATWVLLRTRAGNWIFAAGGGPEAARNVGVPVSRVKIGLFMTTALAACLVAVLQAVRFTGADALRGELQEFRAIIAVVIGGTLLTGGYGSAIGAVFGALIFGMVQQGIVITGIDADWFQVALGAMLVVAVVFNNYIRKMAGAS